MENSKDLIKRAVSNKELRDSGLAFILLCLLAQFLLKFEITNQKILVLIVVTVLTMIVPKVLYPWAVFWFSFTNILGFIVSRILLSVIFFVVVFPVAILRKLLGKDSLKLKSYGKNSATAFINRDKLFSKDDLQAPY